MYQCPSNHICEIRDLQKYAWVNSQKQIYSQSKDASSSQVNGQKTIGYCRKISIMNTNLNNGRQCSYDNQCLSMRCVSGYCKGKTAGENCAQHSDCDQQLACIQDLTWPFASKCKTWKTTSEVCYNDNECSPKHFCWYQNNSNVASDTKTCLEMHTKNVGQLFGWKYVDAADDFINSLYNGQYCKSGLAVKDSFQVAKCIEIQKINTDMGDVLAPYQCTVINPASICKYYYDASNYLEESCQCGFNGSTGYCPHPSQTELSNYISYKFKVLQASKCHTLDRADFRAQSEECGIGPIEDLKIAINLEFNYTMWPYVQTKQSSTCLTNIHPLSHLNLLL
eukprot:403361280